MLGVILYLLVEYLYTLGDVLCGELVSEMDLFAEFLVCASDEAGTLMFTSLGCDHLLFAVYDFGVKVFMSAFLLV